eukprot:CFRG7487T1
MKLAVILYTVFLSVAGAVSGGLANNPNLQGFECKTIAELLNDAVDLSILLAATDAANLTSLLNSTDNMFTVFAPNDGAFEKLPNGTLEELLQEDGIDNLIDTLTYHVSEGTVGTSNATITMLNGQNATIIVTDNVTMINNATAITVNITACNGVVHIVDHILIPPLMPVESGGAMPVESGGAMPVESGGAMSEPLPSEASAT